MLDFKFLKDKKTGEEFIETSLVGKLLLTTPQLNKGTAFTEQEREDFGLLGKLPAYVETLAQQVHRAYLQYLAYNNSLQKNIYLNNLHDKNQVLFYKLVSEHLEEILPNIYTPIVGTAVKEYSREFRQARGLYIAYPYQDRIEDILDNRSHPEIDLIVVTDGEGVLGIGDQGVGGMDIPIAKLMVYTLCAGINPLRTLPIMLDVGTNNQQLLNDPLYLGLRHERIRGEQYDHFIDKFISAVLRKFPKAFLHWEDFGRDNALRNLQRYQDKICSFNDDIQGTGATALAALMAAVKVMGSTLAEQRIVIFGAGSAGTGIAHHIYLALRNEGLSEKEARACFWLHDKAGLLTTEVADLTPAQLPFARPVSEVSHRKATETTMALLETIREIHPTVLIGCSAFGGAFNEAVVREMAKHVQRPVIFPLSNPNERAEAQPADLFNWTAGKALVATGSPFPEIDFQGRKVRVAQCNNALIFPGIGLGVVAVKANRLSDKMLWAACQALCAAAPILQDPLAPLLPMPTVAHDVACSIALAVAKQAVQEGLTEVKDEAEIPALIDSIRWQPRYMPLRKKI